MRELYEVLCMEADAEVMQMMALGWTAEDIHAHGMKRGKENVDKIIEGMIDD